MKVGLFCCVCVVFKYLFDKYCCSKHAQSSSHFLALRRPLEREPCASCTFSAMQVQKILSSVLILG